MSHELNLSAAHQWVRRYADMFSNLDNVNAIERHKNDLRNSRTPEGESRLYNGTRPIQTVIDLEGAQDLCLRRQQYSGGLFLRVCGYDELFHRLSEMHKSIETQRTAAQRKRTLRTEAAKHPWLNIRSPVQRLYDCASSELFNVHEAMCRFIVNNCSTCKEYENRKGKKRDGKKRDATEAEMEVWDCVASGLDISASCARDFFTAKRSARVREMVAAISPEQPALAISGDLWERLKPSE